MMYRNSLEISSGLCKLLRLGTSGHDLSSYLYHGTIVSQIVKNIRPPGRPLGRSDLTVVKQVSGLGDAPWNTSVEREVLDYNSCETCDQLVKAAKSAG